MKFPSAKIKMILVAGAAIFGTQKSSDQLLDLVSSQIPVQHIKVASPPDTTGWKTSVRAPQPKDHALQNLMSLLDGEVSMDRQTVALAGRETTGWPTTPPKAKPCHGKI